MTSTREMYQQSQLLKMNIKASLHSLHQRWRVDFFFFNSGFCVFLEMAATYGFDHSLRQL